MNSVNFPEKFGKVLDADHHQKVILKFSVTDKPTKEKMKVHQVKLCLFQFLTNKILQDQSSKIGKKYSGDLNTKLVWYLNGPKQFFC